MSSRPLRDVIAGALRIEPTAVQDSMGFGATPEWDSLNHVALMMELEAEYGVSVSDDEVVELTDVPAIQRFLETRTGARPEL